MIWKEKGNSHISFSTKKKFQRLHENFKVIRHPPLYTEASSPWTHNQRMLIVDQVSDAANRFKPFKEIAFIGGLDICYGRYDTQCHAIVDPCHLECTFPGK